MTDDGEDANRRGVGLPPDALSPEALRHLSVPKTRFSWDHGHLSRPVPSRGMPQPGGGLRVVVSADAVEQRQRHG